VGGAGSELPRKKRLELITTPGNMLFFPTNHDTDRELVLEVAKLKTRVEWLEGVIRNLEPCSALRGSQKDTGAPYLRSLKHSSGGTTGLHRGILEDEDDA
jgi:hypothetical protein